MCYDIGMKKSQKNAFSITLEIGSETYTATGPTLKDAIMALDPKKVTAKCVFRYKHDGKTAALMKNIYFTRRVISHDLTAALFAEHLTSLLK